MLQSCLIKKNKHFNLISYAFVIEMVPHQFCLRCRITAAGQGARLWEV